ncbi:MAG: thermonuclease family protein [Verrucomicrobiae bacterium]|nr:thermonuclease family protein [Verrucomicrobiae bacterium]
MARASSTSSAKPGRLWRTVGILVLIGAAYWYQEKYLGGAEVFEQAQVPPVAETAEAPSGVEESAKPESKKTAGSAEKPQPSPEKTNDRVSDGKVNGYDKLAACRLVDHRNNDGDSFWVRHGDRQFELRLYYADTAEKYLSDRYKDQRRRVGEQARDFGGISIDQTVELGKAAKLYTARLLEGKSFTVYTKWEHVYGSDRVYGWVEIPGTDGEYLSERLVDKGIARIHTKGEPSPDGASYGQYKAHLEKLERAAKEAHRGAWGLN